jgi:DNA-binding response OmpR family regulator
MNTRRILLADDDESVRRMVGRVLESEHYVVLQARTGREAISAALSGAPDLVLLDIGMPEKDGWEAFELIDRIRPFVPVIVITGRASQRDRATQAGIDALMEKPLDLTALLKTIHDLLGQSDLERVHRLTDRHFTTTYLAPAGNGPSEEAP